MSLDSEFLRMRRTQLRLIAYSFLVANVLVCCEICLLFLTSNNHMTDCQNTCMAPNSASASLIIMSLHLARFLPTELFLISFWVIPKRFYAADEDEAGGIITMELEEPLLPVALVETADQFERQNMSPRMTNDLDDFRPRQKKGAASMHFHKQHMRGSSVISPEDI